MSAIRKGMSIIRATVNHRASTGCRYFIRCVVSRASEPKARSHAGALFIMTLAPFQRISWIATLRNLSPVSPFPPGAQSSCHHMALLGGQPTNTISHAATSTGRHGLSLEVAQSIGEKQSKRAFAWPLPISTLQTREICGLRGRRPSSLRGLIPKGTNVAYCTFTITHVLQPATGPSKY